MIKESQLQRLKGRLEEVRKSSFFLSLILACLRGVVCFGLEAEQRKGEGEEMADWFAFDCMQELANTQQMPDDSASE